MLSQTYYPESNLILIKASQEQKQQSGSAADLTLTRINKVIAIVSDAIIISMASGSRPQEQLCVGLTFAPGLFRTDMLCKIKCPAQTN